MEHRVKTSAGGPCLSSLLPLLCFLLLCCLTAACGGGGGGGEGREAEETAPASVSDTLRDTVSGMPVSEMSLSETPLSETSVPRKSRTARYLDSLGLRNVAEADSTILVDLMYARADNFTGQVLYDDLREAYLHPDALESLLQARRLLEKERPDCRLLVCDAARPMSVQRKMWEAVRGTSKYFYVSNPARGGGLHNYGLAVDITLADAQGRPLPMGTPVDHMGPEAHITDEARLVEQGKLTPEELDNRLLLRRVMKEAGFRPLPTEWWHFNRVSRQTAKEKYRVIP